MKAIATCALALFLAITLTAAAPKVVDYSGKWTLDKPASKSLPHMFDKVSAHRIDVAQTSTRFTVAIDITRSEGEPIRQTLDFDLTGKATQTETTVHTPDGDRKLPMTLKSTVREDGRVEVTEEREMRGPEGAVTATTYELWDISADGKPLTIHRKDQMSRGTFEYDMVFTRS
ncbi:MAG: hypothetical protein QOI24_4651 [Acidobacteriota bacterium]|jgi:hypothetical protein|nr:hypothetical protein [Acidobacteriota bacterium]